MITENAKTQRLLEVILVIIVVALDCVLYQTAGFKLIVLNLFYLPVVLAAFFLGRYRAGILALFSVISASSIMAMNLNQFAAFATPNIVVLSLTIWGAVLGLTALLAGTLSDDRQQKMVELHEAHVGVVEVLSQYLHSANPKWKARSNRVAELSQQVARRLKLSSRELDDIRVAALLHDMENIEITSRVIRKAIGDLDDDSKNCSQHTFHGTDLVRSLGSVLSGALPLLADQRDALDVDAIGTEIPRHGETPFGARILQTVRAFDLIVNENPAYDDVSPWQALDELQTDASVRHHPAVLHALEQVIHSTCVPTSAHEDEATETEQPLLVGS